MFSNCQRINVHRESVGPQSAEHPEERYGRICRSNWPPPLLHPAAVDFDLKIPSGSIMWSKILLEADRIMLAHTSTIV